MRWRQWIQLSAGHRLPERSNPVPELPKAWLNVEEDRLVPPRSVWIGPDDSISHYYRWIWEYLAYLTLVTELQRRSRVLELGCGHGRLARGLLEYLRHPGGYVGIDVDNVRIDDAKARLQTRFPNFEFIHANVYNRQTNPDAGERAERYSFPLGDGTFDVVFAASLFTHLLPQEARRYFAEAARVVKPGGKCLFSFFILDHYRGVGTATSPQYEFEHAYDGRLDVAVRDPLCPDVAIAYRQSLVAEFAAGAGLRLVRVIPGLWAEPDTWAVNEQDLVLLVRT
jgi:SAM-dependent methyltransferase